MGFSEGHLTVRGYKRRRVQRPSHSRMGTRELRTFAQYQKEYEGRRSFEDFADIFLNLMNVEKAEKKLHLVGRNELHQKYSEYCNKFQLPKGSHVNIGRHLGFVGIKCDTKIGPAGAQVRFYSGLSWVDGVGSKTAKKSVQRRIEKRARGTKISIRIAPQTKVQVEARRPEEENTLETLPGSEVESFLRNLVSIPLEDLREYCNGMPGTPPMPDVNSLLNENLSEQQSSQPGTLELDVDNVLSEGFQLLKQVEEQNEMDSGGFFPLDFHEMAAAL